MLQVQRVLGNLARMLTKTTALNCNPGDHHVDNVGCAVAVRVALSAQHSGEGFDVRKGNSRQKNG